MVACRGIRGATTATANTAEAIGAAAQALLREVVARNGVDPGAVASAWWTLTADLDAAFPAAAARALPGWSQVPMLCAQEVPVPGDVARCVRLLLHVNTERAQAELRHVYLGEAKALREDLG